MPLFRLSKKADKCWHSLVVLLLSPAFKARVVFLCLVGKKHHIPSNSCMKCPFKLEHSYIYSYLFFQANEKSRDILIEQRFHRMLIGAKGDGIKAVRDKFNQVQITFPDQGRKSDVVTLRGPKTDVDKCFVHLQKMTADMVSLIFNFFSSYTLFN